jgi:translation initiation factor IF-2
MAKKTRVSDIARQRGTSVDDVLAHLKRTGVTASGADDEIDDDAVERAYATPAHRRPRSSPPGGHRRRVIIDAGASRRGGQQGNRDRRRGPRPPEAAPEEAPPAPPSGKVKVPSGASVKDLSQLLGISTADIIKTLMRYGEMATITQSLSDEAVLILADEFKRTVEITHAADEHEAQGEPEDKPEDLQPRPPVITVMGHVDHGKTSLLDAIRQTEVAAGEAGGITQHIGAYQVRRDGRLITFIDTPGHEAFTAMRARGAKITDIAAIVVAADDGVMPQTVEAIDHAKAAGVPIVIVVNKIDKPEANVEKVKQQLTEYSIVPEEWGGENVFVEVSAKKRLGLENLLEMLLLVADVADLKANPNAPASGYIIESKVDVGRGVVATMLVLRGTLHVGDGIVAGEAAGRVRAMRDFRGETIDAAGPATPVEIIGFDSLPNAGEFCRVVEDEKTARALAHRRATRVKAESLAKERALTLDDLYARIAAGKVQELNLIVKADVQGTVEALEDALNQIKHPEVKLRIIRSGVGAITESDVMLASASQAIVIGFNVRPNAAAQSLAEQEGVDVRTYRVIYKVTEDVRSALVGMLKPEFAEEVTGTAEVRQLFRVSRLGTIAGCYVTKGSIARSSNIRVVRDGTVVHDGRMASLKRFQEDVRDVQEGFECGILLDGFNDLKEGDVLEAYETKEVAREV